MTAVETTLGADRPASPTGRVSPLRKATIAFLSVVAAAVMVFAAAAPANATYVKYWDGSSIQNQTHFSPTTTIYGGQVLIVAGSAITAYHVTQGEASHSGLGGVQVSHAAVSNTRAYCYMRWGNTPVTLTKQCWYDSNPGWG
jgi:hypothetical protein